MYQYDELSSRSRFSNFEIEVYDETGEKNPKDFLIYLKGFVGSLQAQVLVDNGATLSLINQKFAQKLPLR